MPGQEAKHREKEGGLVDSFREDSGMFESYFVDPWAKIGRKLNFTECERFCLPEM